MADIRKSKKMGLRQADRLSLLMSYQAMEAEPAGAFDDAVTLAARLCDAPVATLAFIETRRQWFKARFGVDIAEGVLEGSLNALAIHRNENLLVVGDVTADKRFLRDPVVQARPSIRFYAGAVLTVRDGAAIGVLSVYDDKPRPGGLDAGQIEALLAVAGGVVRELEGRRVTARAPDALPESAAPRADALVREMTNDQLQKALRLSKTIPWELNLPASKMILADNARDLIGLGSSVTMTRFRDHIHVEDQALFDGVIREAMSGDPGEVEVRFRRTRGRQVWLRVRAQMLSHFSVAGTLVDTTDERQRDRSMDESATRDHLTSLPARGAFQEKLQKELKLARLHRNKLAVLFVDIDDLEDVNATFGHHAGDAVLREAARRISALAEGRGSVGRARDDEFILFLRSVEGADAVGTFCASLLQELRGDFIFEGNTLNARSSIGAAIFPDHQRDLTRLLQAADTALKAAKESGRDRSSLFSIQETRELERRARETQALRAGLARNDILPFYQPIFDLQSGEVVGLEALARWRHPSKGVLAANYFKSAFDNPDTAAEITEAMIRAIAADSRVWIAEGLKGVRVSLNVVESELRQANIAERILSALAASSLSPDLLSLEASEAALARSDAAILAALESLRAAGVRVSLDNFGKMSASLSILRTLPFDRLKIDRSLVACIDTSEVCAAVVDSIITLGRGLKIDVIAEGVETIPQLEKLRNMRCSNVQGYLLGAPMVAARIPMFVRRYRGSKSASEDPYSILDEPDPFGSSSHAQ